MFAESPYSRAALTLFLGRDLKARQFCSKEAASELAIETFRKTSHCLLSEKRSWRALSENYILGIACSASLVTAGAKQGRHRCHVAVHSPAGSREGKTRNAGHVQ